MYTADDLIPLERALALGIRQVKFADREVLYNSIPDIQAALIDVRAALAAQDAATAQVASPRITRLVTNSGFNTGSGAEGWNW